MHPINPGSDKFPFGDYTARAPPLPIPNREVKPRRADDTWWLTHGKVGRRQGFFIGPKVRNPLSLCDSGFFIWHKDKTDDVLHIMQTYPIPAQSDLSRLAHLAANGEEVLLTENDKPLAKLVPIDEDEAYRREVRSLMGFAKGIPPFVREEDEERG